MKNAYIKVVFDRKKVSTTQSNKKPKTGVVEIRVTYERKQKYFYTGIAVYKNQWSESMFVINSGSMIEKNTTIRVLLNKIQSFINRCIKDGKEFSFVSLNSYLEIHHTENETFLEFMERMIEERTDIKESSKKRHRTTLKGLIKFGGIITFGDLTKANIAKFDDWLHRKYSDQVTIYGYHKYVRAYINKAIFYDIIKENPYEHIKIECGKSSGI